MSLERLPLPIFPLSNVVLFPRLRVPLHIFEPRYRQMTERALSGDGHIGMVTVLPEHAAAMHGDPPVYPVGCAGAIERAEKLTDGRYNIVLLGAHRFRILCEWPREGDRLYRVAEVEPLEDAFDPAEAPRVTALRLRAIDLAGELLREEGSAPLRGLPPEALRSTDDAGFANALSNAFALEPREKQGLLEADSISQRLERLVALLDFRLAERAAPLTPNPGSLH